MFFADPAAAFANLRRALRPAVVWRSSAGRRCPRTRGCSSRSAPPCSSCRRRRCRRRSARARSRSRDAGARARHPRPRRLSRRRARGPVDETLTIGGGPVSTRRSSSCCKWARPARVARGDGPRAGVARRRRRPRGAGPLHHPGGRPHAVGELDRHRARLTPSGHISLLRRSVPAAFGVGFEPTTIVKGLISAELGAAPVRVLCLTLGKERPIAGQELHIDAGGAEGIVHRVDEPGGRFVGRRAGRCRSSAGTACARSASASPPPRRGAAARPAPPWSRRCSGDTWNHASAPGRSRALSSGEDLLPLLGGQRRRDRGLAHRHRRRRGSGRHLRSGSGRSPARRGRRRHLAHRCQRPSLELRDAIAQMDDVGERRDQRDDQHHQRQAQAARRRLSTVEVVSSIWSSLLDRSSSLGVSGSVTQRDRSL